MTPSETGTILVVDDESALRYTLMRILQQAGYTINAAEHAMDALRLLGAGPYDLAVLDLSMPDMDGLTLLAHIRQLYPEMPVLILTAHASLDTSIRAIRHGARDYLLKPLNPLALLARVTEILQEGRQPQRRREIVSQIQKLMAELLQIDGEASPVTPPVLDASLTGSSARFLQRDLFTLDQERRLAWLAGRLLSLTPTGFDYLVVLTRYAPNPVKHVDLAHEAQGYQLTRAEAQELTRWRMHELRQAIEPDPTHPIYLLTVRGTGYRLVTYPHA